MPIDVECPHCHRKFRVPEKYAGKRVKCPKCEGAITIAAAEQPPVPAEAQGEDTSPKQVEAGETADQRWYLKTGDGQQFGPATREELDAWVAEGRIDASCQLLCEGWNQWKWADEVFPDLAEASTETQVPVDAAEENPFAAVGEKVQPSQPEVNPYVSPGEPPAGFDAPAQPEEGGTITPRIHTALAQTRPWVLFLAILGFIGGGLVVLVGLGMLGMSVAGGGAGMDAGIGAVQAVVFLVMSTIYLVPSYYLLRYGQQIGRFLRSSGTHELETALIAQKSFWKLIGILTLVFMALYAVLIVVAVVVGIASARTPWH